MDKGIYTATSGGLLESRRLQNVSNNLANANTVGFKPQRLVNREQAFKDTLVGTLYPNDEGASAIFSRTPGVVTTGAYTNFEPGPVSYTGNPLDIALGEKNQFFVIQTPQGEEFTRAGNFSLNSQGIIVSSDGFPVMGSGGPINVGQGVPRVNERGEVVVDGRSAGRIRTVQIDDLKSLEHRSGTRFGFTSGVVGQAADVIAPVIPQSVELPKNTVVESMVEMIGLQRSFEAYTKVVKTLDELNDRVIRLARGTG